VTSPRIGMDLSHCPSPHSLANRAGRLLWNVVWLVFCRFSPHPLWGWRRFWLRLFGARIGARALIFPSVKIWAPWNLEMGDHACLGRNVECYSADRITLGAHALVSQYSYLCAASHDHERPRLPLVTAPISIGASAWVAADAFVGPGVTVGEGAVVGARACVMKDVEAWTVVGGNPARFLKRREIRPS
jgi:putative colanic acid biosynthesis acetyltransferase WcaF